MQWGRRHSSSLALCTVHTGSCLSLNCLADPTDSYVLARGVSAHLHIQSALIYIVCINVARNVGHV